MDYHFVEETTLDGVTVYKFEGEEIFDVSDVYPDFSEQIWEQYRATNYIEPVTGMDVSFSEQFTDYALVDGKRIVVLDAWDEPTDFSEKTLLKQVKNLQSLYFMYENIIPTVIGLGTLAGFIVTMLAGRVSKGETKIAELEEIDKQKDEFVSMVSHEIKNPLNSHYSHMSVTTNWKRWPSHSKTKRKIEQIMTSCDQLTALLSDFADIKKLDMDAMKLKIQDVEPDSLFEKIRVNVKEWLNQEAQYL